jgi:DNA-binding NtrC family response regulator
LFDLVITDVCHPGVNGLVMARYAKEHFGTWVIIFTGYRGTMPSDAEAAGADPLIYKPASLETLLHAVKSMLATAADGHQKCPPIAEGAVLFIDDVLLIFQ